MRRLQRTERGNARALDLVRHAHHRGLDDCLVTHERRLDLHRSQAMAGNINHVIDAPHDPEIAALVAPRAVASKVHAGDTREVRVDEPLPIAVDTAQHPRPGFANNQQPTDVGRLLFALIVDHSRIDAKERQRTRAGHRRRRAGQRRNHVPAGFRLPPCINDRTPLTPNDPAIPHPRLGIDRLAHRAQYLQTRKIVFGWMFSAPLHKRADGGRRGVKLRDLVTLHDVPEAIVSREVRRALIHQRRNAGGQDAVDDVAVARDPTDICGAPEHLALIRHEIENIFAGEVGVDHIPAGGVNDTLGFTRRAGGVQQEQHVFAVHRFAGAVVAGRICSLIPPDVAAVIPVDFILAAFQHDRVANFVRGAGKSVASLIDIRLERNDLAAPVPAISGDDDLAVGILHAIDDCLGAESAEDHRMHGADPRAGEHGDRQLRQHTHVDRNDVTLLDAKILEHVGKLAHLALQIVVGKPANFKTINNLGVSTF